MDMESQSRKESGVKGRMPSFVTNLTAQANKSDYIEPEGLRTKIVVMLNSQSESNNVILLGDPGCGKTALMSHLAFLIKSGQIERFKGYQVFSTSTTKIMSNQTLLGQMEGRITQLMDFLDKQGDAILFIDEIHRMIGTGAHRSNPHDLAALFLERITNPTVRIIGATTPTDSVHLMRNPAFMSRFSIIQMPRVTPEFRNQIIQGMLEKFDLPRDVFSGTHCVGLSVRKIKQLMGLTRSFMEVENISAQQALKRALEISETELQH
jgi:ATP-dependent Clp protease ATP-binding subunit ClpA